LFDVLSNAQLDHKFLPFVANLSQLKKDLNNETSFTSRLHLVGAPHHPMFV